MDKKVLYDIIGKNIRKYRLEYNKTKPMTQEMLAEYAGISTSLISKLESSKVIQGIGIETLYKISIVLNKPISCFMEENNE